MNTRPNILLFSAFNEEHSEHLNQLNHYQVLTALKARRVPAIELIEKVNGEGRLSILVIGFEHTDLVEGYLKTFGVDTYLKSHNDRFTERINVKKIHVEPVGYLKTVSETQAVLKGTYSFNPQTNTFHTIESRP